MSQADLRGKFVWHELMTPEAQAAAEFYARVLPWRTEASTVPGYTLWMSGMVGIAGLMGQPQAVRDSGTPPSWLVYIAAPDVDATVEAAQRLGGKVLKSPTDIPGIGRFAVLSDPQGAAFAVFMPAMAASESAKPPVGRFSWHELATVDPQNALAFYAQLFGWTRGPAHDMGAGGLYQIIEHAGAQIGGVHVLQDPSKPPHWLSYVRVERLDEAVAAVQAHGGRVLRGPHVVPGGDRVAHVMDPQGGTLALHEPPAAAAAKPAARRSPAAPGKAKRAAKPAATRASARQKPAAKAAVKRSPKRTAKRAAEPSARRAAKRAAKRAPARKVTAKRRSVRKSRAASHARPKKSARRTARRRARRR
jgi:predicted enzyme related to lactoylglutathione lyase